jgi:hypothetical protein
MSRTAAILLAVWIAFIVGIAVWALAQTGPMVASTDGM